MTFLEAVEDTSSYAGADEKSEDFYGGGGQFRKGGKEHFPQLWCSNGTYSSYGQVTACVLPVLASIPCLVERHVCLLMFLPCVARNSCSVIAGQHLSVCLLACLPICLPVCLSVRLCFLLCVALPQTLSLESPAAAWMQTTALRWQQSLHPAASYRSAASAAKFASSSVLQNCNISSRICSQQRFTELQHQQQNLQPAASYRTATSAAKQH